MSGVVGVHEPAPEGDTDQRFAVCVAPFPGLELGCASLCVSGVVVCVRRGWSPRTGVSLFRFSVVPFLGLEFRLYQRYRMTTIDAQSLRFLFYFISHHNLSRESGNSLDQIQISRESRLP